MTRAISGRPARCLANKFTAVLAEVEAGSIPDYPVAYDAGKASMLPPRLRVRRASAPVGRARCAACSQDACGHAGRGAPIGAGASALRGKALRVRTKMTRSRLEHDAAAGADQRGGSSGQAGGAGSVGAIVHLIDVPRLTSGT